jgi:imidazolonepropionase-like amidohydrolase
MRRASSHDAWRVRAVPLPDGTEPTDLWISGGRLHLQAVPEATDLPGGWVAPGLVDAHVHLTFQAHHRFEVGPGDDLVGMHLDLQRDAGVLAVRDVGSLPGAELRARPGVVACGPILAPPDFFIPSLYAGTPPRDAVAAARAHVRAGWPWVKLIADFPVDGNPMAPRLGYPLDLVEEIVVAAHQEGGRVAAHVMGDIVGDVARAGVDSIEHGTWADEDAVREMAARGTAWTPTLTTVLRHVGGLEDRVPPVREMLGRQRRALPLAEELGVTIMAGTDEEPHGSVAAEVAALARFGLSPAGAIAAATTVPRAYLGLPGLSDGAPAELVTFDADPREDLDVLRRPAAIVTA